MTMTHPGMHLNWVLAVCIAILLIFLWSMLTGKTKHGTSPHIQISKLPLLGRIIHFATTGPWVLLILKIVTVTLFLMVIAAGLYGSPISGRNLATVLTWNLWWAGLIIMIFFLGSAWCSICPWDAIATWMIRRRLWRRAEPNNSLNLQVPVWLRNIWPALFLFIGLTWLELGVGITMDPYATAILALLMVVMATLSLALFKRKAFCRYFCPIGRTIGFYSQLAVVELRPIDPNTCASCTTLECYHGNEKIEPCPTSLVMGSLTQNTYCTSCGNCTQSCPDQNVAWRLRSPSTEVAKEARPHWDEAWFMLSLMTLTTFHGITMMPFWEKSISSLARVIGDSGQLLWSFSIGLFLSMAIPILIYALSILTTQYLGNNKQGISYRKRFVDMAFVSIPIAFAYHIAHNLNHLLRENSDLSKLLKDPLGRSDVVPLSISEKAELLAAQMNTRTSLFDTSLCISPRDGRVHEMLISQGSLFTLQAVLLVVGFYIAALIIRNRGGDLINTANTVPGWRLSAMLLFSVIMTLGHLWLLSQPMIMRL